MDRRTFLKSLGGLGAAGFTAGCQLFGETNEQPTQQTPYHETSWGTGQGPDQTATATPSPDRTPGSNRSPGSFPYDHYETIVNMAEAGADRNGNRSITSLVEAQIDGDTLLYFPAGEYLVDDTVEALEFTKLGLIGDEATIRPPDGADSVLFDIGRPERASAVYIEGLEFDVRAPDTGGRILSVLADGPVEIRDISVRGNLDAGDGGMMRVDVTDKRGTGLVEQLRFPDGSTPDTSASGCYVGDEHRGNLTFVDCHIEGFADNGLYGDPDRGTVHVRGGYFANCNVSSLRVGDGATVYGARIRCDRAPAGFGNMRGLRLRHGGNIHVDNCVVEMVDATGSDGAIVMASDLRSATIENTAVRVDKDTIAAIRAKEPSYDPSSENQIRCENVHVSGFASEGPTIEVSGRTGFEFTDMFVQQSGPNRVGFHADGPVTGSFSDSVIDVTGEAIVTTDGATVNQRNLDIR